MLRFLELCLTGFLLVTFSPILIVTALAILIDSGLPIFYMSPRIGKNGQSFDLFYFRTMKTGAEPPQERLTRVGRFLRHNSLDHLPQFFNLLRGDMHIMGPRPMTPEQVDLDNPNYQQILNVKPGMFSPAIIQLGKYYNASTFSQKVTLEQDYLDERTFRKDIQFFGESLSALLKNKRNVKMHGDPKIKVEFKQDKESQ